MRKCFGLSFGYYYIYLYICIFLTHGLVNKVFYDVSILGISNIIEQNVIREHFESFSFFPLLVENSLLFVSLKWVSF